MPSEQQKLALEIANLSGDFKDDADTKKVILGVLREKRNTLKSRQQEAEAEQARLSRMISPDSDSASESTSGESESLSEEERERRRLREMIGDE